MRPTARKALYIILAILLVALVVVANVSRSNSPLRDVRISLQRGKAPILVSEELLEQQLLTEMPWIMGLKVKEINTSEIQQFLAKTPYVEECHVSISIAGNLVVKAVQRRPIVRVFCGNNEFYLDSKGRYTPLSDLGDAEVLVANGAFHQKLGKNIEQLDASTMAQDSMQCHYDIARLWVLASYLDQHPQYGALFDQLYIAPCGDLMLTPKLGNHVVKVGDIDQLDQKFRNLWALYTKGLPKAGWDAYSMVSLKYDGQVICTKRK